MPVDDEEIETMLQLANTKEDLNCDERSKLKIFIGGLKEIKKIEVDGKLEVKIDRHLGTEISTLRRQAIFDKLLVDRTELGL